MSERNDPAQTRGVADERPAGRGRLRGFLLRDTEPPLALGIVVAIAVIAGETMLVSELRTLAPDHAFGALFLLGVLVVSAGWGLRLAVATSFASMVAYVYFHLDAGGSMLSMRIEDATAIVIFLSVALLANVLGSQARVRAVESEHRRREADLAADLARLMLQAGDLRPALDAAGQRMAEVLDLRFAVLEPEAMTPADGQSAIALGRGTTAPGTLLVPADLTGPMLRRVQRLVPALDALLAAAREREAMHAALEASRRELEKFFDLTSDLVFIGDGGYLRRLNPAFERTLGYSAGQLLSKPLIDLVHPDDRQRTACVVGALLRDGGSAQFENRCLRSDGAERWLEWSVVAEGGVLYGAARDVTDRRWEQDRLRRAQRMIEASHAEVSALAAQQTALRRVATLVAGGAEPSEVYPAAIAELSRGLGIDHVVMVRYDNDDAIVVLAARHPAGPAKLAAGERLPLDETNILARMRATGKPARADSFDESDGATVERVRRLGLRSGMGAPIVVDGRVRGALIIGSAAPEPLPPDTEDRIADFADLVATAIANAETRSELTASRARIVAAADQARRRFERDLHDGAQQRLVSLGLQLRAIEASVDESDADLRARLSEVVTGLVAVSTDLQEISRGIHPAILSRGGLGPAIKTLARRSPVPTTLDIHVDVRLPESVEVAAYYVIAEALTNTAKHAQASEIEIAAHIEDGALHIRIGDDGVGGAAAGSGSGLIGLKDRVAALSGRLDISSPAGAGTTLLVTIPLT
ncbi:MAG: PAS domain-containing protein [Actinobacteria bacterium]|nr:PAS domain-containing protein [Actinomycetota bacterium]